MRQRDALREETSGIIINDRATRAPPTGAEQALAAQTYHGDFRSAPIHLTAILAASVRSASFTAAALIGHARVIATIITAPFPRAALTATSFPRATLAAALIALAQQSALFKQATRVVALIPLRSAAHAS
jgi:hypothetical protein